MEGQFHGKVALVTGGNSGIGAATALGFAREGAKVVIAARRKAEGEATVERIENAGGDAIFVQTDVSQPDQVEAMVAEAVERYGRLDYAFNNAGVGITGSLHEFPEDDWDLTMDVNLKGVWLCMKCEIAQMLKQNGGVIVNDSSTAGLGASAWNAVYSASKHGVIALTKSAAQQYGHNGIRVNAVCPGWIETPMSQPVLGGNPELQAQIAKQPIGRIGTPDEVAEVVTWLCSDAASFVTGLAMAVDGGLFAGRHR
jgi:NAD(P)-dependent dehydrogenase (short-subunit alcohol dehydrogenase family)